MSSDESTTTRVDSMRPIRATVVTRREVKGPETEADKERQEWARQMRLRFTPKDMINPDGSINEEYFKPKMSTFKIRKWTEAEKEALIEGIKKHGIGKWDLIQRDFLPDWEPAEIRVKTSRLIGRQSLVEYIQQNWKGDKECIMVEYNRNKSIGLQLGQWKGALINDEAGVVKHALETWPYPEGYVNPYMPSKAAHTTPVPQSFFPKSFVGQKVAIWSQENQVYYVATIMKYDDDKRTYRIRWKTGEETEMELNPQDKTTNPNVEIRWCLEKELEPEAPISTSPPSSAATLIRPSSPTKKTRRRWQNRAVKHAPFSGKTD